MKFSVIIPTYNEERCIQSCINSVLKANPNVEIIVVDGGSSDATTKIASNMPVRIIYSRKGRGIQCNSGADIASGDILLFLYADLELPVQTFTILESVFAKKEVKVGTFMVKYRENHWIFKLYAKLSKIDSIFTSFGDQCITISKDFFVCLNGFPAYSLFEDVELLRLSRRQTKVHCFPCTLIVSARKFLQNGIYKQSFLNFWYMFLYMIGVSHRYLAAKYFKDLNEDRTANSKVKYSSQEV